jgi:trans-aconitate 2-methyltransferase
VAVNVFACQRCCIDERIADSRSSDILATTCRQIVFIKLREQPRVCAIAGIRLGTIMHKDTWNPQQYDLFKDQRQRPFFDLLALVKQQANLESAVDLGCGTGELTQILHTRLGLKQTKGIDKSESMLAKARQFQNSGLNFEEGLLENWHDSEGIDLIFSNAALQWVPDHRNLLPKLLGSLKQGGQIAFQVPANHDHMSHRLAGEVASTEPFKQAFASDNRVNPVLAVEDYAKLLNDLGIQEITAVLKVYGHILASPIDLIEWVKGTLLTYYQARLPTDLYALFLERYSERLLAAIGNERPYYYPFKRILFHGFKRS